MLSPNLSQLLSGLVQFFDICWVVKKGNFNKAIWLKFVSALYIFSVYYLLAVAFCVKSNAKNTFLPELTCKGAFFAKNRSLGLWQTLLQKESRSDFKKNFLGMKVRNAKACT